MYKVGDKVIIKEREGHMDDYPYAFVDSMTKFSGKIATITEICEDSNMNELCKFYNGDNNTYSLDLARGWTWHSSMFSKVGECHQIEEESFDTESIVVICDDEGFFVKDTPIIIDDNTYDKIGKVDKNDSYATYKAAHLDMWVEYYRFRINYEKILESYDVVISHSDIFGRIEVRKQKSDEYPFVIKLSDGDVFELTSDFKYFKDSKLSII